VKRWSYETLTGACDSFIPDPRQINDVSHGRASPAIGQEI
jgi:hypothetical protein